MKDYFPEEIKELIKNLWPLFFVLFFLIVLGYCCVFLQKPDNNPIKEEDVEMIVFENGGGPTSPPSLPHPLPEGANGPCCWPPASN